MTSAAHKRRFTMAKLIYMAIMSLDGYVADGKGNYDWAMPDDEVFSFVNDFERPVGTYLYGRRLYEEMAGWESAHNRVGQSPLMLDFAQIWQAAVKVGFSRSPECVPTAGTRVRPRLDPQTGPQVGQHNRRDTTR